MLWLALAFAVVPVALHSAPASKGPLHLRPAVDAATFVCIGRVESVQTVDLPPDATGGTRDSFGPVPQHAGFGRIRIERVLKGDPTVETVFHEIWPTWLCDTTRSFEGQRCVFLLGPGQVQQLDSDARDRIANALGDGPILRSLGSGDGVVPIEGESPEEWVQYIYAPEALTRRHQDTGTPEALRPLEGRAYEIPLTTFVGYVADLCRFDPRIVAVHALAPVRLREDDTPFDLRILSSGSVRLATGGLRDEKVRVLELEPARWAALRNALLEIAGERPLDIRDAPNSELKRILKVALEGRQITFSETIGFDLERSSDARRTLVRSGMRAWSLVRGVIDFPECVDHRPADKKWLER